VLAVAVPEQLDFDPTVLITINLFTGRPRDDCMLIARYPRLGVFKGWSEYHVPRCGDKVVTVALTEAIFRTSVRHRLFQHLGL